MRGRRSGDQERFAASPLGFNSPRLHTIAPDDVSAPSISATPNPPAGEREMRYVANSQEKMTTG